MSSVGLSAPGPVGSSNLHGVPRAAERRGVREVEVWDVCDSGAVGDGGGEDVDALGDFGGAAAEDLRSEEAAGDAGSGDAQTQGRGTWVVGLVVVRRRGHGDRVISAGAGAVVP